MILPKACPSARHISISIFQPIIKHGNLQKPMQPKNRFFANLSYETLVESEKGSQWKFDLTFNQIGKQRLPDTSSRHPTAYQLAEFSKAYQLLNAQITRVFSSQFESLFWRREPNQRATKKTYFSK